MEEAGPKPTPAVAPAADVPPVGAFVTRLTPQGRGAIAVLRVWGSRAIEIVDAAFRPDHGVRLSQTPRGRLRLGRLGRSGGDEVVVAVLDGEPPCVEVQCHGGNAAIASVVGALCENGATTTDEARLLEDFTNDRITREALADLAFAPTVTTAEILLDQAHGALRLELDKITVSINDSPDRCLADIERVLARAEVGLRLLSGWKVVIAGRPNVGKSRLFNALVGFTRAIVDPTAGTTRDVVSQRVAFAGWTVELADTAGLRESNDAVEKIGVERSRHEQQLADLVLIVLDRSVPLEPSDRELIAASAGAIFAANKSDLAPAWHAEDPCFRSSVIVTVSAEKEDGLSGLIDAVSQRLVPNRPPPGVGIPFRKEHIDRLLEVRSNLLAGNLAAAEQTLAAMTGS